MSLSSYEVEYSYVKPMYDRIVIEAASDDIHNAEEIALDHLSDLLPPDINDVFIETIKELKPNE